MRLHLLPLGTIRAIGAPVPGYLIRLDDGTDVLVDTGYPRDDHGGPVEVRPDDHLERRLAALGLTPADIDVVVCSHLDLDHVGNHELFGHAEFVVQRTHLAVARGGAVARIEQARPHWGRPHLHYREVDGDVDLLPGITLLESSGHVPGHQSVLVRLPRTGPVLLAVDAVPLGATLDPDTRPILPFDLDAATTRASTRKLVDLARHEGALLVRGHDPVQWRGLRTTPAYYD